jgi:tRNA nucleotidyltransferase/poly(A) polymerase
MRLFANCRIIGRRFRIAHIYFREGSPLEVTTFRRDPRKPRKNHYYASDDNEFGTAEQDAWRRDLTINGLFYDHTSQRIIDHIGGLRDLRDGIIRIIGDPKERFHEDPVRILRAIRHASRVGFTIEPQSLSEIQRCAHLLKLCSPARILEEFLRELRGGNAFQALQLMLKTNVLREWQPFVYHWLKQPNSPQGLALCETLQSPALTPQWGHQAAFWSHLQALDQYAQKDLVFPDEFLLIAFFLPFWWRSAFALAARFHKKPHLLWRDAFFQSVDPYLAGLQLSHSRRERFYEIMADYWRIPTLANQPILPRSLLHSPSFPAYVELYRLELLAHDIPPPAWLEEQKPQSLEGIPAFQWVDF